MRPSKKVGIVGWGAYVPMYRIKTREIARVWGKDPRRYEEMLLIEEKAVAGPDEDTATIAIEAAQNAIMRAQIEPSEIGAVFVGTESKPYAVKPTATIVAEAVGATPNTLAADFEFACKAGTENLQCVIGLVGSGMIKYGMSIGADVAQSAPGDELEFAAAAGGAAFIIGETNHNVAARIEASYSFVTDTPDFWRREGQPYPKHGEGFTGEPAYFRHVLSAARALMEELSITPRDIDYVVFHMPNGKFPLKAARILGFSREQILPGLVVRKIGNTYSASSLLGLVSVLEVSKPGDNILLVSYGSGAGSDAFLITVEDAIEEKKDLAPRIVDYIERKRYVDYAIYAKWRGKILIPRRSGNSHAPKHWREIPQRYKLMGSQCEGCGKIYFPPRPVCPNCRSTEMVYVPLPRRGRVVNYTVIRQPPLEFKYHAPYVVAIVELENGVRITSQLTDVSPEDVRIGMEVEAVIRKLGEDGVDGIIFYGFKFRPALHNGNSHIS